MYFVELLCDYCFLEDHIQFFAEDLSKVFISYIEDPDIELRVASCITISSFLTVIEDKKKAKEYAGVLPKLLQTLIEAVKHNEDAGVTTISSISNLLEAHPNMVKLNLEDLLNIMVQIFKDENFPDGLRNAALTLVQNCATCLDVATRKSINFKNMVLPGLLQVLAQIEKTELAEWAEDIDDQVQ